LLSRRKLLAVGCSEEFSVESSSGEEHLVEGVFYVLLD
jgi:hypothetical protein